MFDILPNYTLTICLDLEDPVGTKRPNLPPSSYAAGISAGGPSKQAEAFTQGRDDDHISMNHC